MFLRQARTERGQLRGPCRTCCLTHQFAVTRAPAAVAYRWGEAYGCRSMHASLLRGLLGKGVDGTPGKERKENRAVLFCRKIAFR
jgi:hypothetical protein